MLHVSILFASCSAKRRVGGTGLYSLFVSVVCAYVCRDRDNVNGILMRKKAHITHTTLKNLLFHKFRFYIQYHTCIWLYEQTRQLFMFFFFGNTTTILLNCICFHSWCVHQFITLFTECPAVCKRIVDTLTEPYNIVFSTRRLKRLLLLFCNCFWIGFLLNKRKPTTTHRKIHKTHSHSLNNNNKITRIFMSSLPVSAGTTISAETPNQWSPYSSVANAKKAPQISRPDWAAADRTIAADSNRSTRRTRSEWKRQGIVVPVIDGSRKEKER